MLSIILTFLPYIVALLFAVLAYFSVKGAFFSVADATYANAVETSDYAYWAYIAIIICVIIFAIILPLLSELKGQHQRVRQATMLSLFVLAISVFVLDYSSRDAGKINLIETAGDLIKKGKSSVNEAVTALKGQGIDPTNERDGTLYGIVNKRKLDIEEQEIFKELLDDTNADIIDKIYTNGYTLLGTAINKGNLGAVIILLEDGKVDIRKPITKGYVWWGVEGWGKKYAYNLAFDNKKDEIYKVVYEACKKKHMLPSFNEKKYYNEILQRENK